MQSVSNDFKNQIVQPRTIDAKIIIGQNEITSDDINNIKRTWNTSLFKSVAKSVDLDTNTPIDKDTEIEPQFGLHINNAFEYVSLGKYKVHDEPVLNKDTNSYQSIAYDKIVDSMIDYQLLDTEITYPCTVRDLFVAIFTKLNWNTSGIPSSFVNSTSIIQEDVFSKANMTYRDVLDELCTISCNFLIDINEVPTLIDKNVLATISTTSGTNMQITNAQNEPIQSLTLKGDTSQDGTPTPSSPQTIHSVTGDNTIEICGKNLFHDYYSSSTTLRGITITGEDDGVKLNGTYDKTANVDIWLTDSKSSSYTNNMTLLEANTQYTISVRVASGSVSSSIPRLAVSSRNTDYSSFSWNYKTLTKNGDVYSVTFTPDTNIYVGAVRFTPQTSDTITFTNAVLKIQIEKSSSATSYEPYQSQTYEINLGDIELNKIGDYQDGIYKSTGKNLFDKTSNIVLDKYISADGTIQNEALNWYQEDYIEVKPSTNYIMSSNSSQTIRIALYDENKTFISRVYSTGNIQATTTATTKYVRLSGYNNIDNNVMLNEGTTATNYEPYGIVWYIKKEISSVTFTGATSENWSRVSAKNSHYRFKITVSGIQKQVSAVGFSNYFKNNGDTWAYEGISGSSGEQVYIRDDTLFTEVSDLKTWLSTHNIICYYVLATPTYTKITDSNLIGQLELASKMKTYKGINNITITASDLASPITIGYVSNIETINEEYMCDNSVDIDKQVYFNSLVFSRVNDSDNIYRKDDTDIEQNGLHEFKVKDLQILSMTWRDNFIDEMWNYIKNFRYYAFDVNTNGITYLEPIDYFYLSTFGDTYPTILMNSDLAIGNGVNEMVYAKEPIESTTEYKYADTTDKKINQAYIVVDKQNAQIQQLTQTTSNLTSIEQTHYQEMLSKMDDKASLSDIQTITNQVNTLQTDTYTKTEINKIIDGTDENGLRVQVLQSTSAVLNEDGMTYNKTGAKTSSNINQAGFTVTDKDNSSELLFAGYDTTRQEALVRVANLYLTRFLGLDDWRVEIINDSTNGKGLGFFYIG